MSVLRQCLAEVRISTGEWSNADAAKLQLPPAADANWPAAECDAEGRLSKVVVWAHDLFQQTCNA